MSPMVQLLMSASGTSKAGPLSRRDASRAVSEESSERTVEDRQCRSSGDEIPEILETIFWALLLK
jgi:hypothetical protein